MSLYRELKRRNVFRVAIAYLAAAWLLTEVAGTLFPAFGVPDWGVRFIVILFALGFLPALIVSWAYELTPEGLKREKEVVRDESITHLTAKRLDWITIFLITVALVFIVTDRFFLSTRVTEQPTAPVTVATNHIQTSTSEPTLPAVQPDSIAVLPFTNRSSNPDDAFFVDGIHDDLLTYISKIGSLKTISRTSVMRYRNSDKSIPEIAAELGVSTVLEGGVQRAGQQIRINVQLIDAISDEHLWAEIYDRQLSAENIFAIQSEISRAISVALETVLTPAEQRRISAIPTGSLEAYEAYLLGKQRMERRTVDSLEEAVVYLSKAVEIDPQFALAWSNLADVYMIQRQRGGGSGTELLLNAEAAINKALKADPDLGEIYASLAMLRSNLNDRVEAGVAYRKAIELAPNYSRSYHWYSIFLTDDGRIEEAFETISKAAQLDPMSPIIRVNLAGALRIAGRNEEAWIELEKAIEIDPEFTMAYEVMATMEYMVFNRMARAAQGYLKVIQMEARDPTGYVSLGQLYLELGMPDRAGMLFGLSHDMGPDSVVTHWGQLLLKTFKGNTDDIETNVHLILKILDERHWIAQVSVALLRNQLIADEQHERALDVYATTYPELRDEPGLIIGLHNYRAAIDLALVFQQMGEWEKANDLLDQSHDFISGRPRLGWPGGYWISDVLILTLKGKKAEALAALRDGVDEDWRSLWWYYLRLDPNLESIRNEPEFQLIVSEIEADMFAQMRQIREMENRGEIGAVPNIVFDSE